MIYSNNKIIAEKDRNKLLSTKEVAIIFGVDTSTIRRWYHKGRIRAERENLTESLRFSREQVAVLYITSEIESFIKDIQK